MIDLLIAASDDAAVEIIGRADLTNQGEVAAKIGPHVATVSDAMAKEARETEVIQGSALVDIDAAVVALRVEIVKRGRGREPFVMPEQALRDEIHYSPADAHRKGRLACATATLLSDKRP